MEKDEMATQKFPDWSKFTPEAVAADMPRLLAEAEKGVAEINVAKQRNGPIGKIKLIWQANLTKFQNME